MHTSEGNIYKLPQILPGEYELFESIISKNNLEIERIISCGQKTPENQWLEQDKDEWVVLLQGESELNFDDGRKKFLKSGDYVFISKNQKHRVERTSKEPPCIWLAVHF